MLLLGSILAIAALLSGCHPAKPDNQALIAALHRGRAAEVTVQGPVVGLLPDGNGPTAPTSASASTWANVSWSRSTTT
jgi:hypothetical protein